MTAPYSATNPPRYLMKKLTKKQDYAILGGTTLMSTVGFYLFWDAYYIVFSTLWKPYDAENGEMFHATISWHVAFIIGATAAFILTKKLQKKPIYFIAEALVGLSGLLMAIPWDSLLPIIIARYFGGLGHGLAFVTVIIHASEIAMTNFRANVMGVISGAISTSIFFGFFFLAIYTTIDEPTFLVDQTLGVLTVILAAGGMVCNLKCTESPIFHLERGDREAAVTCLKQVRHDWSKPEEIQAEITELESLVRTQEISHFPTIKATIRVVILFGLYSMSNFFVYNFYAFYFVVLRSNFFGLSFVYFGRMAAETLAIFFIDTKGRRLFLAISILGSGVCMGIIGILLSDLETDSWYIWAGLLFFFFNCFVGAGLSPISVVLLGESFLPNKKQLPILLAVVTEHILQIIVLSVYFFSVIEGQPLYLAVGVLYILVSVPMYIFTPETKQITLEKSVAALS